MDYCNRLSGKQKNRQLSRFYDKRQGLTIMRINQTVGGSRNLQTEEEAEEEEVEARKDLNQSQVEVQGDKAAHEKEPLRRMTTKFNVVKDLKDNSLNGKVDSAVAIMEETIELLVKQVVMLS